MPFISAQILLHDINRENKNSRIYVILQRPLYTNSIMASFFKHYSLPLTTFFSNPLHHANCLKNEDTSLFVFVNVIITCKYSKILYITRAVNHHQISIMDYCNVTIHIVWTPPGLNRIYFVRLDVLVITPLKSPESATCSFSGTSYSVQRSPLPISCLI